MVINECFIAHASEYYVLFLRERWQPLPLKQGRVECSGQQRIDRSAAPIKISPIKISSNESKMRPSAII
jgi:hypothetical protein